MYAKHLFVGPFFRCYFIGRSRRLVINGQRGFQRRPPMRYEKEQRVSGICPPDSNRCHVKKKAALFISGLKRNFYGVRPLGSLLEGY